jgi:hypothetical protein
VFRKLDQVVDFEAAKNVKDFRAIFVCDNLYYVALECYPVIFNTAFCGVVSVATAPNI